MDSTETQGALASEADSQALLNELGVLLGDVKAINQDIEETNAEADKDLTAIGMSIDGAIANADHVQSELDADGKNFGDEVDQSVLENIADSVAE